MRKSVFLTVALCCSVLFLHAQEAGEIGIGFKAGLNFSRLDGPAETDVDGTELDNYDNNTGFQIGISVAYAFTDLFGVKGELLYSQKGGNFSYVGPSYFSFYAPDGTRINSLGTRDIAYDISNSYLDLPVMIYGRLGRLELAAGVNVGYLITSTASGGVTVNTQLPDQTQIEDLNITLDYNFLTSDFANEAIARGDVIVTSGLTYIQPSLVDAYYESGENGTKLFNRLDLGLNADVSYFLNSGLYASLRLNYGLSDVTKMEQDLAQRSLNPDGSFQQRDDMDRNVSIQTTLGFRF